MPTNIVKKSYGATTQYYYSNFDTRPGHFHMYKSPWPAANVFRRDEDNSTDTVYADTAAWGGYTCVQLFAGCTSYYLSAYKCRSDKEFARILEDNNIRSHGACFPITRQNLRELLK